MDPTETLAQIIAAIQANDYRGLLVQDLRDLADWLEKEGFYPDYDEAVRRQ